MNGTGGNLGGKVGKAFQTMTCSHAIHIIVRPKISRMAER